MTAQTSGSKIGNVTSELAHIVEFEQCTSSVPPPLKRGEETSMLVEVELAADGR